MHMKSNLVISVYENKGSKAIWLGLQTPKSDPA